MIDILKAPFPYFGGKSKIASLVWGRFGEPANYCEPFFGSGAVLLGCPWPGHTETVNDACGLLANFWRALQHAPDEVANYADWPVNEADLHARHRWLVDRRPMVEELMEDPEWYDAKAAGWWVWGISQWIGTGWCPQIGPDTTFDHKVGTKDGELWPKRPQLSDDRGVHRVSLARQMPRVGMGAKGGNDAVGVHSKRLSQQMPSISDGREGGFNGTEYAGGALYDYFRALSARLRRVRVVCGDFERILGPSVTWRHGLSAIFLDPPYADAEHAITYSGGGNVWERTTRWCEENSDNPLLRIALCGYSGSWEPPSGWKSVRWKTSGGYGSQGNGRGRENAERECVWFSPACIDPAEDARGALSRPIAVRESDWSGTLFDEAGDAA